jgi:hypothetical protein
MSCEQVATTRVLDIARWRRSSATTGPNAVPLGTRRGRIGPGKLSAAKSFGDHA